jgi:nitroreductase
MPDLLEIMRTTRSMRRLKPDPVPDELVRQVLEAGTCAANAGNMQSWRFLVVQDPEVKRTVAALYSVRRTSRLLCRVGQESHHPVCRVMKSTECERQGSTLLTTFTRLLFALCLAARPRPTPEPPGRPSIPRFRTCCLPLVLLAWARR